MKNVLKIKSNAWGIELKKWGETLDHVFCSSLHFFRVLAAFCVLSNRTEHSRGFSNCWAKTQIKTLTGDKIEEKYNISYILRFSLRNLSSQNPVHGWLQPIRSEKGQFHAWRKRFVQSRRTCQKYFVFAPSPLPAPSVYLKLSFVVGFVNILKGVWSSVVKFIP